MSVRSKLFLLCILSFIVGVFSQQIFGIDFFVIFCFAYSVFVFILAFCANKNFFIFLSLFLFFVLGFSRSWFSDFYYKKENHVSFFNDSREVSRIVGFVSSEPDIRQAHQKLTIDVSEVDFKFSSGKILVQAGSYLNYEYGDEIILFCDLENPGQIEDFQYDKYLARYDIYSVCWRGDIEKTGLKKGSLIKSWIFFIKSKFIKSINMAIGEPHASFLAGLLVGARNGISSELMEDFSITGTTHIIAISGSNISIIAALALGIVNFFGFSKKTSFFIVSIWILLFVVATGASASVVRAGIMGTLVLLSKNFHRSSKPTNAIAFTAFCMIGHNPKILSFDAGFQLSFLATTGIVYISPVLLEKMKNFPEFFGVKESLVTTISAIITTTPLILYQFGRLSLISPVANVLVLPAIPPAMAFGFFAGFVGVFFSNLARVLSFPAYIMLEYIIKIVEFLSNLPFSSFDFGSFHPVFMISMYLLILFFYFKNNILKIIEKS